jgi:hypothetical protein
MGRPKLPKRKISISVTLEDATKKYYKKLGEGNHSKGIELAAKMLQDCQKELKDCKERMAEKV